MPNSSIPSDLSWSTHWEPESSWQPLSIMGYHRSDGRVGTRNYWLVIPLFSVNREQLALFQEAFQTVLGYQRPNSYEQKLRDLREQYRSGSYFDASSCAPLTPVLKPLFTNIDGIQFLPVYEGDPMVSEIEPYPNVLAGYYAHPNVGGITVLSGGEPNDSVHTQRQLIDQRDQTIDKPLLVVDRATFTSDGDWLTAATHDTFRAMALLDKQTRRIPIE